MRLTSSPADLGLYLTVSTADWVLALPTRSRTVPLFTHSLRGTAGVAWWRWRCVRVQVVCVWRRVRGRQTMSQRAGCPATPQEAGDARWGAVPLPRPQLAARPADAQAGPPPLHRSTRRPGNAATATGKRPPGPAHVTSAF